MKINKYTTIEIEYYPHDNIKDVKKEVIKRMMQGFELCDFDLETIPQIKDIIERQTLILMK